MPPGVAVGVDLVEIERVAGALKRHPKRFLTRHFTDAEQRQCDGRPSRLAARWAAKEAAAKVLGTGIGPIGWHEVEVLCDGAGAPKLALHGEASRRARELDMLAWSVSLTHSRDHALAVVAAARE